MDAWYANQFGDEVVRQWDLQVSTKDPHAVKRAFLSPLLDLLLEYLRTGETRYLFVYLDERLRYAPHGRPLEDRVQFFRSILHNDVLALIEASRGKRRAAEIERAMAEIHTPLLKLEDRKFRLVGLGDCLMNEIRVFLPSLLRTEGLQLDMRCIYFSAVTNKGLSIEEVQGFLATNHDTVDMIAVSFFTFEGIAPYKLLLGEVETLSLRTIFDRVDELISLADNYLADLRGVTDATFLLHNVSGLPLGRYRSRLPFLRPLSEKKAILVDYMNHELTRLSDQVENCVLMDEAQVANESGLQECSKEVTARSISKNGMFHTSQFGYHLANQYVETLARHARMRRTKVLCLDFDNTLWDGVMADGEVEQYRSRQEMLSSLREQGILLVAVSKNSIENIRWEEMQLGPEDFALLKINWNLKAQSLREAADELNLGIDSFVFIDDNPVELELAETEIAGLVCLDARDAATWADLRFLFKMPATRATEESKQRTVMYQAQANRRSSMKKELDYPKMMASLALRSSVRLATEEDLDRASELVARTNQFNTTTIRYSKSQLRDYMASGTHHIVVAELADKFSNLGIVCVAIVEITGQSLVFDSFIMSCRAMGFSLENQVVHDVINRFRDVDEYVGRFVATDRNSPCSGLFASLGFTKRGETEWVLNASARATVPAIGWIEQSDSELVGRAG